MHLSPSIDENEMKKKIPITDVEVMEALMVELELENKEKEKEKERERERERVNRSASIKPRMRPMLSWSQEPYVPIEKKHLSSQVKPLTILDPTLVTATATSKTKTKTHHHQTRF
jgi:hypothetical protein